MTGIEHPVELQTVAGHESVTETALMDAEVMAITGTLAAATSASQASVEFVPNGETRFRLPVQTGAAIHAATVDVTLAASLSIPMPPLTQLTHHPERTERRTKTVSLWRPGTSQTVSETVTVTNDDGTTTEHTISATLSIPGETVYRDVTLTIVHPEHVKAEVVERSPISRTREESLSLASGVGADAPFEALVLPESEPEEPPAEQTPADGGLIDWFNRAGMGVAVVRRLLTATLLSGAALATTGVAPPEERAMLEAFDRVLTALSYAAAGLAVFAIVWAGFVLMAEGADDRGGGRAKTAVVMAVVGLVLVLLAKAVAALLRSGLVPFPTP